MATLNFDANTVDPTTELKPLPEGDYKVAIVESQNKPTKAGNGSYLELKFEVLDGESKGRKLFDRLNLDNPNAQAVEIAKGTLSAICRAVNVMTPRDSSELHNRPLYASVKVKKRADTGDLSNEVKGYKPLSEGAKQPAAAVGSAPWEK